MLAAAALAVSLLLQTPVAQAKSFDPRDRDLKELDAAAAQTLVAQYRSQANAKAPAGERAAWLRAMVNGKHKQICDEILKNLKDPAPEVRLEAVKLLGTQPCDASRAALLGLCRSPKSLDPTLGPEAIRSLGAIGYGAKGTKQLEEIFYGTSVRDAKKAVVQAIGRQKDKQGLSLIVVLLDPPRPKDPNAADNPPAEFWTEKNDEWITYKDDVYAAFERITGRKFYSSGPAIDWIAKDGKKLGLKFDGRKSPWM